MNRKIFILIIPIILGVLFTFLFLNRKVIYAKEKYNAFVLQAGAFKNYEKAIKYVENINNGIIIYEDDLYKVYVGIYNNIDIVNKMLVLYENKGVHIYLKEITINKNYYINLKKFESIMINSNSDKTFEETTKLLLRLYKESESSD